MPQQPDMHHNITKRLGTTMTLLAWLLFLGILSLLFGNLLEQEENPNSRPVTYANADFAEVMLEQNRAGHYVATAEINNIPVTVIVDTGASHVSVPAGIANTAGLIAGPTMEVSTANGTIPVSITVIDSIKLGRINLKNVRASINPYMEDDFVLLGMSFLENVEITQADGKMILRQYKTR